MDRFITAAIRSQLHSKVEFIDKVRWWYEKKYPEDLINDLSGYNNRFKKRNFPWGTSLRMFQPTQDMIKCVVDNKIQGQLSYVEAAVDLCCNCPGLMHLFLKKNLRQKYTRESHVKFEIGRTIYNRPKKSARGLMLYSDSRCKITGDECVHIEVRITGKRDLERLNLTTETLVAGIDYSHLFDRLGTVEGIGFGTVLNNYFGQVYTYKQG